VVPGSAGGEGCSAAGGCATCPFMKMNDLDAVHDIIDMIGRVRSSSLSSSSTTSGGGGGGGGTTASNGNNPTKDELRLSGHLPPNRLGGMYIDGRDAVELGTEPIAYMRDLMRDGRLSDELVERVERAAGRIAA